MQSITYYSLFLAFFLGCFSILILTLISRKLIQQQVQENVDEFFSQARIPKSFRGFIKVRVKWKGFMDSEEQ